MSALSKSHAAPKMEVCVHAWVSGGDDSGVQCYPLDISLENGLIFAVVRCKRSKFSPYNGKRRLVSFETPSIVQ